MKDEERRDDRREAEQIEEEGGRRERNAVSDMRSDGTGCTVSQEMERWKGDRDRRDRERISCRESCFSS